MQSREVRSLVQKRLKRSVAGVTVRAVPRTDLVVVSVKDGSPRFAAAAANAYATSFIEFRRTQAADDLLSAVPELDRQIADLQVRVRRVDTQLQAARTDASTAESLTSEREGYLDQLKLFRQKRQGLVVDAALKSGSAQVVEPAIEPASRVSPRPIRNGLLGGFVGLVLGLALAAVLELMDDSLKRRDDLEALAPALPVLGLVPAMRHRRSGPQALSVVSDSRSTVSEAYRAVRTALQFVSVDRRLQIVQVTSAMPSEGKSTTAANLALVLSLAGRRVLLVDGDLRKPSSHTFFGLDAAPGLSNALVDGTPAADLIHTISVDGVLGVLPAGDIPPNPAELLASRRTATLFESLRADWDVIVVDSPPVLPITDAVELSQVCDGVVFIALAGKSTRSQFRVALQTLESAGAVLVGSLLNRAGNDAGGGYGRYGYGGQATQKSRSGTKKSATQSAPSRSRSAPAGLATNPAAAAATLVVGATENGNGLLHTTDAVNGSRLGHSTEEIAAAAGAGVPSEDDRVPESSLHL